MEPTQLTTEAGRQSQGSYPPRQIQQSLDVLNREWLDFLGHFLLWQKRSCAFPVTVRILSPRFLFSCRSCRHLPEEAFLSPSPDSPASPLNESIADLQHTERVPKSASTHLSWYLPCDTVPVQCFSGPQRHLDMQQSGGNNRNVKFSTHSPFCP
jgi:hypothetical protein